jgi:fatty-acid desaturase
MQHLPESLNQHRVSITDLDSVCDGEVRLSLPKFLWLAGMAGAAIVGGIWFFSWSGLAVFFLATGAVLLFGHSLGSHRKLIHDSYQCPKWLEYTLVLAGSQVGLAGPLGLMRQHELRDYAQRLPDCHDYLRHGRSPWVDAWWQLNCELRLANPPAITIEPRIANDRFYRFLEATWMQQHLAVAVVFYLWGGWGFVFWGVCARVTAGVFGHWIIGYFAHNQGGMHHEVRGAAVQGRNIPFTSLLTMGESWHNNHHAFPGSARLGLYAGEWDPGWWMLMLMRRAGLVWSVRLPKDLATRPELHALDGVRAEPLRRPSVVARSRKPVMLAPLAPLPPRYLGWLLGDAVELRASAASPRLVLIEGKRQLRGLPALVAAIGRRHAALKLAVAPVMPLARAFESARSSLDMA